MWILPAGFKTFVATNLTTNYFSSFPWGLEMECSSWGSFAAGCNGSLATQNQFTFSIIGRLVIGDNSGASTSLMNVYSYNSFADIAEMGAVGSVYLGDNANSQEASTAQNGIVGLCVNSNSSSFYGNYAPSNGGYCMNGIGVATTPGGYVTFFSPISGVPQGAPYTVNATFRNKWNFTADDAQGTQVCMNLPGVAIAWSRGNSTCGGPETWTLGYDTRGFWAWDFFGIAGGSPMRLTEGAAGSYAGYTAGNLAFVSFDQGFLLDDAELGGAAPGPERLVDAGVSIPTASFHKQGDIHFNQSAAAGGYAGWVDVVAGANFKPMRCQRNSERSSGLYQRRLRRLDGDN